MSLKDQLLKAGLVSKKDVTRVNIEEEKARKQAQGNQERKRKLEAEAAAKLAAETAAKIEEKRLARKAAELEREAVEAVLRVRQIATSNKLGSKGPIKYHFRGKDGVVRTLNVAEWMGEGLRRGEGAVVAIPNAEKVPPNSIWPADPWLYLVVRAEVARRLQEIDPEAVVWFVTSTLGLSDPSERIAEIRDVPEAPDFRAHKLQPHEVEAWRAREAARVFRTGEPDGRRATEADIARLRGPIRR
jgi:uncharacterized protein YaiL (DUF2058 family)